MLLVKRIWRRLIKIVDQYILLIMFLAYVILMETNNLPLSGLWFMLAFFFVWALVGLWKKRELFMELKGQTEAIIWGKPLKEFTGKELKNTKVKVKWRSGKCKKKKPC